eukprot:TRINITY_DN5583_c0_g1_i1.p1 TRINITY_DN5583_c0_g1~~TRINITY_DN5583_c0_g1_i1.p1  ORF type:complete len:533 (-),score=168.03 TRINITY_DN5583_c0_g1_i1:96-1694(-)
MSAEDLQKENEELKKKLQELQERLQGQKNFAVPRESWPDNEALTVVILGASGDLAKKKTYPALFSLFAHKLIPSITNFVGYARSKMSDEDFRATIAKSLKGHDDQKEAFLKRCYYFHGQYDSVESLKELSKQCDSLEADSLGKGSTKVGNRVFYMAIPPSVFIPAAKAIRGGGLSSDGWNRVVVEKPFGHDLESSQKLSAELANLFSEEDLFRIDHYLGKEMVQNLMALRFANVVFEPIWNRYFINNIQITFKEDIGTEGRGGYFDEFGIIRDVMQNHLMQIFALIGMEHPISLSSEHVRDEKVKLLRCVPPIELDDVVIGQYTKSEDGKKPSYLDDQGVPKDSTTPTFALAVLHVNNERWNGVPFILKCGKALNERKAEIRIQFHEPCNGLYPSLEKARNELVLRVQPNEAIYLKFLSKKPGLSSDLEQSELDLTYKSRFGITELPDAYERLIYDVVRGDHNLFVRDDELDAAWRIFTPLLHKLEKEKIKPELYAFGTRGPQTADDLAQQYGFQRNENYNWKLRHSHSAHL